MARNSEARHALRSLLPERYLIYRRDPQALQYKYRAWLEDSWQDRLEAWCDRDFWEAPAADYTDEYAKDKHFEGLYLECRRPSPATAIDPQSGARIRMNKKDATLLHVAWLAGAQHFRTQLGAAAHYIQANKPLRRTEYVAGFSYREMAQFVMRLGFREMEVQAYQPEYAIDVRAAHMAYCAVNNKDNPFEFAAVYMPTHEFVQTFRPHSPLQA